MAQILLDIFDHSSMIRCIVWYSLSFNISYRVNREQEEAERHNRTYQKKPHPTSLHKINHTDTSRPKRDVFRDIEREIKDIWYYLDPNNWHLTREVFIYIYSALIVALVVIALIRSFVFFSICMRASTKLHDNMFNSITRATMRFFNTNPAGRILNRFSKDMGAIDELLPAAMIDCLQIGLALLGIIIVVGVVNPWLMLPTVGIGIIFYLLRIFYLRTSRNVKRLEGVSRYHWYNYV